jgi:hypothetical protein
VLRLLDALKHGRLRQAGNRAASKVRDTGTLATAFVLNSCGSRSPTLPADRNATPPRGISYYLKQIAIKKLEGRQELPYKGCNDIRRPHKTDHKLMAAIVAEGDHDSEGVNQAMQPAFTTRDGSR